MEVECAQGRTATCVGQISEPQRHARRVSAGSGLFGHQQGLFGITLPFDQARPLQGDRDSERPQAAGSGKLLSRHELLPRLVDLGEGAQMPGRDDGPVPAPEVRRTLLHFERGRQGLQRGELGVVAIALADLAQRAGQRERDVRRGAARPFQQHLRVGLWPRRQHAIVVRDGRAGPGKQPVVTFGGSLGPGCSQHAEHARRVAIARRLKVLDQHHRAGSGSGDREIALGQRQTRQRGHPVERIGRFGRGGVPRLLEAVGQTRTRSARKRRRHAQILRQTRGGKQVSLWVICGWNRHEGQQKMGRLLKDCLNSLGKSS